MSNHPDRKFTPYILSGIETGVGFNRDQSLHPVSKKCTSADVHPQVITEYIREKAAAGHFLGPVVEDQAQFVHISKFGVIPKGHVPGKWCLITDLSSPLGLSTNNGIKTKQLKALLVSWPTSEIVLMEGVGVYCWPPESCMQGGKTREILLAPHV